MSEKLNIDQLEERIAPSSVDLGSLADGILGNANASGVGSGNVLGSSNDPSVAGNTVDALMGNTASTGPIGSGISL